MPATQISAERFWDLYFRNAFLTLERLDRGYLGKVFEKSASKQPPEGLLRDTAEIEVAISFTALHEHDYSGDSRFALITKRPAELDLAFQAVIDQTYPYRAAAPFGKQRMSELLLQIRHMLHLSPMTLSALERITLSLVENHTEAQNQPLAALAWFLGERGERSSSSPLMAIVQNAPFSPFAKHRLHFTPVDAAFTALWRVNDKTSLGTMLELMRVTTDAGRRKIAPLFERLLSTRQLLSLETCGEDYFRPDYWVSVLRPYRNFTPGDWAAYDVQSLFWEIRYQTAFRLPPDSVESFRKLESDEVATVRDAVRARL
jgi:hypothetical protein